MVWWNTFQFNNKRFTNKPVKNNQTTYFSKFILSYICFIRINTINYNYNVVIDLSNSTKSFDENNISFLEIAFGLKPMNNIEYFAQYKIIEYLASKRFDHISLKNIK